MSDILLEVEDLTVAFGEGREWTPVLRGVDFSVRRGERVALVGESGCGKSMTLFALTRLPPASSGRVGGRVVFGGQPLSGPDRRIAYIFQDPVASLDPVMRIGAQMAEAAGPGTGRDEAEEVLRSVDLRDPRTIMRSYPCELSGGMCQRVMIAMALLRKPELLIADEPTTALDATTQADVMELLDRLARERGMALLMATHNLSLVASRFDTINVFYCGEIVESGPAMDVATRPMHPYTRGLLAAMPRPGACSAADLRDIPGEVPSPSEILASCRRDDGWSCAFAPRCGFAGPACEGTVHARTECGRTVRCIGPTP